MEAPLDARTLTPADLLGTLNEVEEKFAPERLWVAGEAELLGRSYARVSVVGSRDASPWGLERAAALSKALVERGVVVVSGLARGIDTAAHTAAMDAQGRTAAVLGTGVDVPFPPESRPIYDRMLSGGHAVVSQFPLGTWGAGRNFPQRNRTMALLSDATVVVEAGEKSGTKHQGWEALRLGRRLFFLEEVASDQSLAWPQQMIGYGAEVLRISHLDSMLEEFVALAPGQ